MGEESFTAWFVADESDSGDEDVAAYGTNLGEMTVGTEDSKGSNYYTVTSGTSYYVTYTPTSNGTLYLSDSDILCYDDTEGKSQITGSWVSNGINAEGFTLTAGTTYYFTFTGSWMGEESFTAWYVASSDDGGDTDEVEFKVVSVTAADGTDLTGNITADNTLDLAVLEDGMQMVIYCSEATGNYLNITFGTVGTEQYLTMTSDRLTADEDGNFTWTGGWDYELTEGYVYPVVCDLYNAQHNGTVVASATVLTLVGTSENKVSDVTLVSSDPAYGSDNEIEVTSGEDLTVTLTFSDYVNISAEISQGLNGSISLNAKGVEDTGDGEGNYTQWTFTLTASQLADEDYGGEITVSISGTDANGKSLFDESGYDSFTYSYTLVSSEELVVSVAFDPESDTTVESLSTILVTGVVEDGECTSLKYESYDSSFIIYKNDEATDYELYYDDEASTTAGELVFHIIDPNDTDDNGNENYNAEITDAGVYTIVIPGNTFSVNGTLYEEPITLTYTIESTEPITLTFDPESGSTVTELGAITVSSEQGAVTYISYDSDFAVSVNGEESEDYIAWYDESQDANGTIVMVVNGGSYTATEGIITDAGEYSVTFPAGTFAVGGVSYDEEVTLTYTIEEAEETVENVDISFNPENGSTVEELSTIEMWIEDADEFDLGDAGWDTTLYVLNADGDQVALLDYSGWNDEATAIVFAVADTEEWEHMTITDAGTYTIDIPEGFLYAGDAQSNAVTLTYTIGDNSEETEYSYTVNPADGTTVSSLSTITISCETGIYVSLDGISGSFSDIKVYNEDGDEVTSASTINSVDAGTYYDLGEEIVLADEIVEAGEYTVVIPEGTLAYFVDGRDGDIDLGEITLTYTVDGTLDGINTIKAAISEGAEVYNLAGQRVVTPVKGSVNVVKYADGTVKKVLQK